MKSTPKAAKAWMKEEILEETHAHSLNAPLTVQMDLSAPVLSRPASLSTILHALGATLLVLETSCGWGIVYSK